MECRKGLIQINADCTHGRITMDVMHHGHTVKTVELAGTDTIYRKLRVSKSGEISLNVTI